MKNQIGIILLIPCFFLISSFALKKKSVQNVKTITKISAKLFTSMENGEGLDDDSYLKIFIHPHGSWYEYASTLFYGIDHSGGNTNRGNLKEFLLILDKQPLTKSMIDGNSSLIVMIKANGRDSYSGNLSLKFYYDDGSFDSYFFGDFRVGTYQIGHISEKHISFYKEEIDEIWVPTNHGHIRY